jgi:hypothetical protein
MEKEELYDIYVHPNIRYGDFTHFVFDNIGWREKTPDGTTCHAISAILIQSEHHEANDNTSVNDMMGALSQGHFSMSMSTFKTRQKTVTEVPTTAVQQCHKTRNQRKSARSQGEIVAVECLLTTASTFPEHFRSAWQFVLLVSTQLFDVEVEGEVTVPEFLPNSSHNTKLFD